MMRLARRSWAVLSVALVLASGCKSGTDGNPSTTDFAGLAGTWVGTWTDTRYGVSGTLRAVITVNGSTITATGTIGLQSLGLGNENGTGTGTVSNHVLTYSFSASTVGNGSGTLLANNTGTGSGSVTGVLNFGAFTYTGSVTSTTISGTFAFTSPTGGYGVGSLAKQ